MSFLKRNGWRFIKFFVLLLKILHFTVTIYLLYEIINQIVRSIICFIKVGEISAIPATRYIILVACVVGFAVLWFLKPELNNVYEKTKDNLSRHTVIYFSKSKLAEFKRDASRGNLDKYLPEEIDNFITFLQSRGEDTSFIHKKHKNTPNSNTERSVTQLEDDEKIISTTELNSLIHKGTPNPLEALDGMIGLSTVKEEVRRMYNRYRLDAERKKQGISIKLSNCDHMCFFGPPGTGKTTVARMMAGILYDLKVIKKNKIVEINGTDLTGYYLGTTSKRTKKIINAARGGVLFIDEAYSLSDVRDYGYEALGELVKAMEDYKDDLVVIFAGYEREMNYFLATNTGLKSRIKTYFHFDNYTPTELGQIFLVMAQKLTYNVSPELLDIYVRYSEKINLVSSDFGNARTVRNDLDKIIDKHADNIFDGTVDRNNLNTLVAKDFPFSFK